MYNMLATSSDKYPNVETKLNTYFTLKKNVLYEVYVFRKAVQHPSENLDTYCTRFRMLLNIVDLLMWF